MTSPDQPRLHTDVMRDNVQEAEHIVAELQESIAACDWGAVTDLCYQLNELNEGIAKAANNMLIASDCAPRGDY